MLMILTLLGLASPPSAAIARTCIPNSYFRVNGYICRCDAVGRFSEVNCDVSRRVYCKPGQIIWEDCSQCICQEDGQLICTTNMCGSSNVEDRSTKLGQPVDIKKLWCIPFVSYYMNCSLCVCPATGSMKDARCATDASCPFKNTTDLMTAVKTNLCIPKVMYLFPCLNCLCSDDGFFVVSKCVETCQKPNIFDHHTRRCLPGTFYRDNCNVCFCPDSGQASDRFCSKSICGNRVQLKSLVSLRNLTRRCDKNAFTGPTCFYCECNENNTVNERACLESECFSIEKSNYEYERNACTPGEMVLRCQDCFCLRTGLSSTKYCTKFCSDRQKLQILDLVMKDSSRDSAIIDRKFIKNTEENEACDPNTIYKNHGKYCLCPDKGETDIDLCTAVIEEQYKVTVALNARSPSKVNIDFNSTCNPNTFVEFDCNTCYCLKNGKLDPKWCTYDDCQAKKKIMESQKVNSERVVTNGSCVPGSISKMQCNFCICPDSGLTKERACTKNSCAGLRNKVPTALTCEPLAYYSVDCNTCYCPKTGVKNVARCTKKTCEKNFLRSQICVPGRLFSDECNVCVCPPNGDKTDRVCSNNTCADSDTPWRKIFKLSQSLLSYQSIGESTRNLDLCFPGEEFQVGCKVCLCPDMGLRVYATCTQMLCSDEKELTSDLEPILRSRRHRDLDPSCMTYNITDSSERVECTPGSMYIIRCRKCICPYMGNINFFCRPLPEGTYCEQPIPNVNYVPMGRRTDQVRTNGSIPRRPPGYRVRTIVHNHTRYACDEPGRLMDECFICDCEDNFIIEEHCFRSEETKCSDKKPSFLLYNKDPTWY